MSDLLSVPQDNVEISAAVTEKAENAEKKVDDSPNQSARHSKVEEQERAHGLAESPSKCCEAAGKINNEAKVVSRRSTVSSYVDYSRVPPSGSNSVASIFKAASAKEPTFPVKLHLILSNPEYEGKRLVWIRCSADVPDVRC
jgi:hypothetical protein